MSCPAWSHKNAEALADAHRRVLTVLVVHVLPFASCLAAFAQGSFHNLRLQQWVPCEGYVPLMATTLMPGT